MKAATIYDVARRAGVSHQTVSRYLSGFEGIRPATRERVEQALSELDYRQNTLARALRLRQSNRIGVLADRIDSNGPARVIGGATQAARSRGYLLDVITVDGLTPESVQAAIDTLRSNQVAGVLATAQSEVVHDLVQARINGLPKITAASVLLTADDTPGNASAGAIAADHLLDIGHRNIGYLAGPEAWIAAQGRRHGFVARVEQRGGTITWTDTGDWSAQAGYDAWKRHPGITSGTTAVAAANDSMAIGLIRAAAESGLSVPQDLSVIGTDDIPEARFLVPALSTVALDFEGEGRAFMDTLINLIEGETAPVAAVETPRLVARSTTAGFTAPL